MPNARSLRRQYLILAVLFFLTGVLSAFEVVFALLQGRISLNFGVCMLFVGIGMLNGRWSSLVWAVRWCVLWLICAGALAVLVLCQISTVTLFGFSIRPDDPHYFVYGLGFSAGVVALATWGLWVLNGIQIVGLKDVPAGDT